MSSFEGEKRRPGLRLYQSLPRFQDDDRRVLEELTRLLDYRCFVPMFEPVADLADGGVAMQRCRLGGAADSFLHPPAQLYAAASRFGLTDEVDRRGQELTLDQYFRMRFPGRLLLDIVAAGVGEVPSARAGALLTTVEMCGGQASEVVVVLDGCTGDPAVAAAAECYRELGFSLALQGAGGGVGWPRMWQELKPEFALVAPEFFAAVHQDPIKQHYLRAIVTAVGDWGGIPVATGVDIVPDLLVARESGFRFACGVAIGRAARLLQFALPIETSHVLGHGRNRAEEGISENNAGNLLVVIPPVDPENTVEEVFQRFSDEPELIALPVVDEGTPIGLINRHALIDRYARPFRRELFGRRRCAFFMDSQPLVVDRSISIEELSHLVVQAENRYLADGFIITENGRYVGMGTGLALMREITQLKIRAARYANPLTGLPGNVPINEHIDNLLRQQIPFSAAYCDLNYFKPFNDVYGYSRGDDIIKLTGRVLLGVVDGERDFVGHVGGDDFVLVFLSEDWEERCLRALAELQESFAEMFLPEDVARGGYLAEDRSGQKVFHPLTSLAIGAVMVDPELFVSHREVAAFASEAKKQAKKQPGYALFVERRRYAPKWREEQGS